MVDELWDKFDVDKNGFLDDVEVKKLVEDLLFKQMGIEMSHEKFEMAFTILDKDKSGSIQKDELFDFYMKLLSD